jgi:hypothetical protein
MLLRVVTVVVACRKLMLTLPTADETTEAFLRFSSFMQIVTCRRDAEGSTYEYRPLWVGSEFSRPVRWVHVGYTSTANYGD